MIIIQDVTTRLAARTIAQFLLLNKNIPLYEAVKLIRKPGADKLIWKLIKCQSDFMGPVPRSLGIDLISEEAASKIQQSLDVKHIKKPNEHSIQMDRIKPITKIDLAYSHPVTVWIRFYSIEDVPQRIMLFDVLEVCPNVYEAYGPKRKQLGIILSHLETVYNADLIFCSDLPYFLYNKLLFLSNYVKFMWCYALNRNIFDPQSYQDIRMLTFYVSYGLMFLETNNLSNMPKLTHNPLIACSGERPKVALSKYDADQIYINDGSRAMHSTNHGSDFGTYSNFMEGIADITLDTSWLDTII